MQYDDELELEERDAEEEDILQAVVHDRKPQRRNLLDAERLKDRQTKARSARKTRDKALRDSRRQAGLCTRCGLRHPVLGRRMCDECQEAGRNYVKLLEYRKELRDESD